MEIYCKKNGFFVYFENKLNRKNIMNTLLMYSNKVNVTSSLSQQLRALSDGFNNLAIEVGITDKYTVLALETSIPDKFRNITSQVDDFLLLITNSWKDIIKKDIEALLTALYSFINYYNTYYTEFEKYIINNNANSNVESLLLFLEEIIKNTSEIDYLVKQMLSPHVGNNFHQFKWGVRWLSDFIRDCLTPSIIRELSTIDYTLLTKQEKLLDLRRQMNPREKKLLENSGGINAHIKVDKIRLPKKNIVLTLVKLMSEIRGELQPDLSKLWEKEKQLIEEINQYSSHESYLVILLNNFITILEAYKSFISILDNLTTVFMVIISSIKEIQYKVKKLTTRLESKEFRFIRGTLKDAAYEIETFKEKLKNYGFFLNLPIHKNKMSMSMLSIPRYLHREGLISSQIILNKLYFQYQKNYFLNFN